MRHAKGLSQEDLAYAAGVNRSYMSTLEREASYPGLCVRFQSLSKSCKAPVKHTTSASIQTDLTLSFCNALTTRL